MSDSIQDLKTKVAALWNALHSIRVRQDSRVKTPCARVSGSGENCALEFSLPGMASSAGNGGYRGEFTISIERGSGGEAAEPAPFTVCVSFPDSGNDEIAGHVYFNHRRWVVPVFRTAASESRNVYLVCGKNFAPAIELSGSDFTSFSAGDREHFFIQLGRIEIGADGGKVIQEQHGSVRLHISAFDELNLSNSGTALVGIVAGVPTIFSVTAGAAANGLLAFDNNVLSVHHLQGGDGMLYRKSSEFRVHPFGATPSILMLKESGPYSWTLPEGSMEEILTVSGGSLHLIGANGDERVVTVADGKVKLVETDVCEDL